MKSSQYWDDLGPEDSPVDGQGPGARRPARSAGARPAPDRPRRVLGAQFIPVLEDIILVCLATMQTELRSNLQYGLICRFPKGWRGYPRNL